MLQNIVHNSNRLIQSQCLDQDSVLNRLIKLKAKRRNLPHFQSSYQQSIFEQPEFNHHVELKYINKRNKSYMASQNYSNRSKSQETSKTLEKIKTRRSSQVQKDCHFTIDDVFKFTEPKRPKIIHSRINVAESFSASKNKVHHQRVFANKEKFIQNNQIIQQPGLTNLCFYKNTLEQINIMRSTRFSTRKKNPEKNLSQRQRATTKTKIFSTGINNKGNDKEGEYRPWSPNIDNDPVQGEFLSFKSLSLRI